PEPVASVREALPPVNQFHPNEGFGHLANLALLEAVDAVLELDPESFVQLFDAPLVLRTVIGTQIDGERAGSRVETHDGALLAIAAVGGHNQAVLGDMDKHGIGASTHIRSSDILPRFLLLWKYRLTVATQETVRQAHTFVTILAKLLHGSPAYRTSDLRANALPLTVLTLRNHSMSSSLSLRWSMRTKPNLRSALRTAGTFAFFSSGVQPLNRPEPLFTKLRSTICV